MSANTRMTPWTVRLSVQMYQRLLVAYPQSFRRQYGTQMAQAFRDCCREAASTGGTAGLLRYWLIAFGDLIVSALAERRREEVHMSRTSWIRLGSLAAIIGGVTRLIYTLYAPLLSHLSHTPAAHSSLLHQISRVFPIGCSQFSSCSGYSTCLHSSVCRRAARSGRV